MSWNDSLTVVTFEGRPFCMNRWRSGIARQLKELWEMMDIATNGKRYSLDKTSIHSEDMTKAAPGEGFANNVDVFAPDTLMNDKASNPEANLFRQIRSDGTLDVVHTTALKYLQLGTQIQLRIGFLIQTCAGPPRRIPEFADTQIRNTIRYRHFMRDHGRIFHICNYTKSTNVSGRDSYSAVALPDQLVQLLDYYIFVLRPLEKTLGTHLYGKDACSNYHYLFFVDSDGQRISLEEHRRYFGWAMKEFYGFAGGISHFRQLSSAIWREYIPGSHFEFLGSSSIYDGQSNHSSDTSRQFYGVTGAMVVTDMLIGFYTISSLIHQLLELDPTCQPPLPLRMRSKSWGLSNPLQFPIKGQNPYGTVRNLTAHEHTTETTATGSQSIANSEEFLNQVGAMFRRENERHRNDVVSSVVRELKPLIGEIHAHAETSILDKLDSRLDSMLQRLLGTMGQHGNVHAPVQPPSMTDQTFTTPSHLRHANPTTSSSSKSTPFSSPAVTRKIIPLPKRQASSNTGSSQTSNGSFTGKRSRDDDSDNDEGAKKRRINNGM